jgi:hypothetical protein
MAHKFADVWHSFLLIGPPGQDPEVVSDGDMDMKKMKDNGKLDDGDHNGNKLTGEASDFDVLDLTCTEVSQTEKYRGVLVFEDGKRMIVVGKFHFDNPREFKVRGRSLTQDDGTWVITKP